MLSLEDKIAQMTLVGIGNKNDIYGVKKLISENKIGGVIIYRNNYNDYTEMLNLINSLKECNKDNPYPLFIAIDQEGGRVNRMPLEFKNIYNAFKLGATNNLEIIEEAAKITSNMLFQTGINMNFAPVLDIKNYNNNQVIGNRAFSSSSAKVSLYGTTYMKVSQKENVIPVIKHFPGHGMVKTDSHSFLPIVYNFNKVKETNIKPFEEAIKSGADAIMIGHILIKGYTGIYPASLSNKFIKEELREKLSYNGVVMTDELSMHSIRYFYGKHRSIIKAFKAGNDIICRKYYNEFYKYNIKKIVKLVNKGDIDINQINDSVNRIIALKTKYLLTDNFFSGCNIKDINTKIVNLNKKIDNNIDTLTIQK